MHPLGMYKVQMWTCEGTAKGCTILSESECTGCAGWGVWGLLVVLSVLAVRWSFHLAGCKNACFCVCVSGLEFLWWRKQVLAQRPRWSLLAISFPYSCSKIRTVNLPHCLIHQPPHPHQHTHIPITHTHTHTYSSLLARTSALWLQSIWTQGEMSRKKNTAWWKPLFITYDRHACGSFMLLTEASLVNACVQLPAARLSYRKSLNVGRRVVEWPVETEKTGSDPRGQLPRPTVLERTALDHFTLSLCGPDGTLFVRAHLYCQISRACSQLYKTKLRSFVFFRLRGFVLLCRIQFKCLNFSCCLQCRTFYL